MAATHPVTLDLPAALPLEARGGRWVVRLPERDLDVSNPAKAYWPRDGYTKGDLLAYFYNVAPWLLPYVTDRPLMLQRFPDGVGGEGFYTKHAPPHTPDWMPTVEVASRRADEPSDTIVYLLAQDAAGLLWLANLGAVELHPWHARVDDLARPDYAFFDLDPVRTGFDDVREVALLVGAALDHLGLVGVPRTSGASGMQVYVPLRRIHAAATVRAVVHAVCQQINRAAPQRTTLRRRVADRPAAVYLDYGMNAEGRTIAATYGPRPGDAAPVATPLTWAEVEEGVEPRDFTIASVCARLAARGDVGHAILDGGQDLRGAMEVLGVADADDEPARHRVVAPAPSLPGFAPMLATDGPATAFDDPGWRFEVKWDGVRALASVTAGSRGGVRLVSRAGNDLTASYPEIGELVGRLSVGSAVLDGELVAFDDEGLPSFQRLQRRMQHARPSAADRREVPVSYVVFDLLAVDGQPLIDRPLRERLARLDEVLAPGGAVLRSEGATGDGRAMLAAVAQQGLEGLVAKRLAAPYRPGKRSRDWRKIKVRRRAECVIGGWTPGAGSRAGRFASLLLGVYDGDALRYVGRVGTGFSDRELDRLAALLAERGRDHSPFDAGPGPPRDARWVRPDLVCRVEYAEVTDDGRLRAPAYKGLVADPPGHAG